MICWPSERIGAPALKRIQAVSLAVSLIGCHAKHSPHISTIDMSSLTEPKRLVRGFAPGQGERRWTERSFAVSLDPPQTVDSPTYFEMVFDLPGETLARSGQAVVKVRTNRVDICGETYKEAGRKLLSCRVPESALTTKPVLIEVESSAAFRDPGTAADRSLQVASMSLKEYEATAAFLTGHAERPRAAMDRVAEWWKPVPRTTIGDMDRWALQSEPYNLTRFFDVPIGKIPSDLWMMQQIIFETKPDFIIETGTFQGGSALYFAWLIQSLGLPARVLTVDIIDMHRAAATSPLWKKYVDFYLGSSTDPAIVKKMADKVRGHRVFVSLDSDHHMLHVLHELKMYSPMVHQGGYVVAEDTHVDGVPTVDDAREGPMAAVERFLDLDPGFERDYTREVAPSFNPGSWLKRK